MGEKQSQDRFGEICAIITMLLWVTKVFECFIYAEHKGSIID